MPQVNLFEHQQVGWEELGWTEDSPYPDLLESLNESAGDSLIHLGHKTLKATQYVGVLQVKDLTIQVLPKIDFDPNGDADTTFGSIARVRAENSALANLLHMLSYAEGLELRERSLADLGALRNNWFELLTRFFALELHRQFLQGPQRSYMRKEEALPVMRGKWLIGKQISTRPHQRHRFEVAYDEFTIDNRLNQIFRFVVEFLSAKTQDPTNLRLLDAIRTWLIDVKLIGSNPSSQLGNIYFDRLNQRYSVAFHYARMFLEREALLLSSGHNQLFAFVFDMNLLFERFVESFIQRFKSQVFLSYEKLPLIKSQAKGRAVYLLRKEFDGDPLIRLRPDLLFSDVGGKVRLILDTKYKQLIGRQYQHRVSEGDIYQMIAYMTGFNTSHAMLLYPADKNLESIHTRFSIPENGGTIHVASINLHQPLYDPKPLIQDFQSLFESFSTPVRQEAY